MRTLIRSAENWGWLLALSLSIAVMVALYTRAPQQISSDIPAPGDTSINVVAREPGTGYNVKAFCDDPTTTVGLTVMTDAPKGGTRYVALRGTESVNWPDSPPGQNPTATHYWTAQDGTHKQELVEVSKDAAACFEKKAKR